MHDHTNLESAWAYPRNMTPVPRLRLSLAAATLLFAIGCGGGDGAGTDSEMVVEPVAGPTEVAATVEDGAVADGPSDEIDEADSDPDPDSAPDVNAVEGVADVGEAWMSLDDLEASHGPGSLVVGVQPYFIDLEQLDANWAGFPSAPATDPGSCNARGSIARDVGNAQLIEPDASPLDIPRQLGLVVEVHASPAEATQRIDELLGDGRADCQTAILELRNDALGTALELKTDNPGGTEVDALVPVDGARTVEFPWVLTGFGPDIPANRFITAWTDGPVVIMVETIAFSDTEAGITAALFDLIAAENAEPPERDADLDAAVDILRSTIDRNEPPAEFFDAAAIGFNLLTHEPDDEPHTDCEPVEGAQVAALGPFWVTRTRASQIGQASGVLAGASEAAQAVSAATAAYREQCLTPYFAELLPGTIEVTNTTITEESHDGHNITVATITATQTLDPDGGFTGDVTYIQTLSAVDAALIRWEFLGLTGDQPDMLRLHTATLDRIGGR